MSSEKEQLARQKVIQKKQEQSGPGSQKEAGGGEMLSAGDMVMLQRMVGNTAVGQLGQIQRAPQDAVTLAHASQTAFGNILDREQTISIQRAPANGQPAQIQRAVPSDNYWKIRSGKLFHDRSPALQEIDAALREYNQQKSQPTTDNQTKVSLLANIQDKIIAWKAEKQDDNSGEFNSKRLASVTWLNRQIEAKRVELELAIAQGITDTYDENQSFSDIAVYSLGSEANSVDFIGETKAFYERKKQELQEKNKPASDVDIRLAMLAEKVAEAHLQMGSVLETHERATGVVGLFTAAEWFFRRPYAPYSAADKEKIINGVRSLSSTHPNMLIVPGSILWGGENEQGLATLNNTGIAVMNGRLLHTTNKFGEGMDIESYKYPLKTAYVDDKHENPAISGLNKQRQALLKQRTQEWLRGGGRVSSTVRAEDAPPSQEDNKADSSFFTVGDLTMSLEICGDHGGLSRRALNELNGQNVQTDGAHVQIVVSVGSSLSNKGKAIREGGIGVGTDAVNSTKKSTNETYTGTRSVKRDNFDDPEGEKLLNTPNQLGELFMGVYQLPK